MVNPLSTPLKEVVKTPEFKELLGKSAWPGPLTDKDLRIDIDLNQFGIDFPVEYEQGPDRLHKDHSWWMNTTILLTGTGQVQGVTRTWSSEALVGFTGSVTVFLFDEDKNIIGNTRPKKYGVNGEVILGAASDRKEAWFRPMLKFGSDTAMSPGEIASAHGISILHAYAPENRVPKALSDILDFIEEHKEEIAATIAVLALL